MKARTSQPSGGRLRPWLAAGLGLLCGTNLATAQGIPLDVNSKDSIRNAASIAAAGLWDWYTGYLPGQTPGLLPEPYYWWEAGALMMTMIDYFYYTGDSKYNENITQALLFQGSSTRDFMNLNETFSLGNDDQAFWAFAALDAAELGFPNPPKDQAQWVPLAQAVFNEQAVRYDTVGEETGCGGGLMWQVFVANPGWGYKNTISNGCLFSLAARLYRYTGNETYSFWAEKVHKWLLDIQFVRLPEYYVYDGAYADTNCTVITKAQWTYNVGVMMHGAANMWNMTEDPIWKERVDGYVEGSTIFFKDGGIMYDACEAIGSCNNDQMSFKAYLSRWMAVTAQLCPWTGEKIWPLLETSAKAAAEQCSGPNNVCGLQWTKQSNYDGNTGPGQEMAATSIFGALLQRQLPGPLTIKTGGVNVTDGSAGDIHADQARPIYDKPITTADRAGAGIVTICVLVGMVSGAWWMIL